MAYKESPDFASGSKFLIFGKIFSILFLVNKINIPFKITFQGVLETANKASLKRAQDRKWF